MYSDGATCYPTPSAQRSLIRHHVINRPCNRVASSHVRICVVVTLRIKVSKLVCLYWRRTDQAMCDQSSAMIKGAATSRGIDRFLVW